MILNPGLIYVSVASYRDPQLIPTIADALAKAARPENLRFGICWQHGDDEGPLPFADDPRFRIIDVDWRDSQGACWARAELMKRYDGEAWFLQLDSHHRFAPKWDQILIATAIRTGSDKPVLTGLTPPFWLATGDTPEKLHEVPRQTDWRQFSDIGMVEAFQGSDMVGWKDRREPLRTRFITAGFLFAPGSFVSDCPYDPDLYFWGEEITLTIRAFTFGYDFFTPTELVLWHLYADRFDPAAKRPHNHDDEHPEWRAMERRSDAKVRAFLREPTGCGSVRTFADYQAYAGLDFEHRCVAVYTLMQLEPPTPPLPAGWASRRCDVEITFAKDRLPEDYQRVFLSINDIKDHPVAKFVIEATDRSLSDPSATVGTIYRQFHAERLPFAWVLYPELKGGGYGRSFYGTFFSGARSTGIVHPWPDANADAQRSATVSTGGQ